MAGIDELQIEIGASAKGAINTIDSLIAKLDVLSTSLSKLNASSLNSLADGVGKLSSSMAGLKASTKASDFSSLAKNLDKLGKVNVDGINTVTSSIKGIADGMELLSTTSFNGAGVAQFASVINKLGGAKASRAYTTLPVIAEYLQGFVRQMNSIGSVTFNVESLNTLVSGISRLGAKNATQATTNLIPLSKSIQTFVTNINSTGTVTYDATPLLGIANAISRLGSKTVTNANNILPQLSTNLNALIQTLANSPQVSQNTIDLVRALGQLSSRGNAVANSTQRMSTGLNIFGHSARNARKHTMSLARAFGTFYANCFLLIRGVKALGSAITKAMNFAETYNYFQSSYRQLANRVTGEWQNLGYESADAYYSALQDNASQLSQKMTGFIIADDGSSYERTMGANLGLDPSMLLNYQAQFAQLSSSMGLAGESASQLSNALSMIGADIASVKNMEFSDVYDRLSSGLVGQSRAVDTFGINIRDTALQEKMLELGIDGSVKKLGQQDKALLRAITILDSSRYAWSDLSKTLDMPANQLRMLKANFSSLATTIGSVFMGAVQSVLPYINALVIALQKLMEYIIKFFGITIPTSSQKSNDAMSDLLDSIYETDDAMDSASGSAKKLKNNLLGIDELNVLNDNDSGSGSGAGGATSTAQLQEAFNALFSEYQNAWNDAFNSLDNQAQRMADGIINAFKKGDFKEIGTIISEALRDALNSINWDSIFDFAKKWSTNVANFLNGLLRPDTFYALGSTIANYLNTVFYSVGAFVRTFDWANAGLTMASALQGFVNTIDIVEWAHTISNAIVGVAEMAKTFLQNAPWREIGQKIGTFLKELDWVGILKGLAEVILNAITVCFTTISGVFDANPIAGVIITGIASAFTVAKVIEIGTTFKALLTSSKVLGLFTSAGASAGTAVAGGMTTAGATGALTASGMSIGGVVAIGITTAIAGFNLGEWIAVNVFGEDTANLLSNNWDTLLNYVFNDLGDMNRVNATNNAVSFLGESQQQLHDGLALVVSDLGATSKAFELYNEVLDRNNENYDVNYLQITRFLESLGEAGVSLGDTDEVLRRLNLSQTEMTDESREFITQLTSEYDHLGTTSEAILNYKYGLGVSTEALNEFGSSTAMQDHAKQVIEGGEAYQGYVNAVAEANKRQTVFNDDIYKMNTNGMPSYVNEIMRAQNANGGYIKTVNTSVLSLENYQNALGNCSGAISGLKDNINYLDYASTQVAHNGMPSYVAEMMAGSSATSQLSSDISNLNTATESTTAYFEVANSYVTGMTDSILDMSGSAIPNLQTEFNNLGETVETTWKDADSDTSTYTSRIEKTISESETSILNDLSATILSAQTNIETSLDTIITNCQAKIEGAMTWFDNNIVPKFSESNFNEILSGIPKAFDTAFKNAFNGVVTIMNYMIDEINKAMDVSWEAVELNGKEVVSAGSAKILDISHIQGFAQGGFPTSSDLFFANENGNAEYVGSFGNRTAVANNDQIVAGITNGVRSAVADVMLPYLVQISDNTRETANKDFSVSIGDRDIARANVRGQRSMGRTLISTT